jgi:hypothetical protein
MAHAVVELAPEKDSARQRMEDEGSFGSLGEFIECVT